MKIKNVFADKNAKIFQFISSPLLLQTDVMCSILIRIELNIKIP